MDALHSLLLVASSNHPKRLDALSLSLSLCASLAKTSQISPSTFLLIQHLLLDQSKETRSLAYKLIATAPSLCPIPFLRSLIRDSRSDSEREAALRIIRTLLGSIPISLARILVALADSDDRFKPVCLQTLASLSICNPKLASFVNAPKSLILALLDGPLDLVDPVTDTLIYLIDTHDSRQFIRPFVEIDLLLSPFLDAAQKSAAIPPEKLPVLSSILFKLLSSYAGLLYFSLSNFNPIKSIINALLLPNIDSKLSLINLFFNLFGLSKEFHKNPLQNSQTPNTNSNSSSFNSASHSNLNLVASYRALLLSIFLANNLAETLIQISFESNPQSSAAAIALLTAILQSAPSSLPHSVASKVQALPSLFASAINFSDETSRHAATKRIAQIYTPHINSNAPSSVSKNFQGNPMGDSDRISLIKSRLAATIDDFQLKLLVNESDVLGIKDTFKWNWSAIADIINGPLLNPRRFDELVKSSKFTSRIITFFKPSTRQFSDLPTSQDASKLLAIAISLFRTLASTQDGAKFLLESKFLTDIADAIAQSIHPGISNSGQDEIFSKERIESTTAPAYFSIISAIASSSEGPRLLDQSSIYTVFYQLPDARGREDLANLVLRSLDYSVDSHPRIILSRMLTAGSRSLRHSATLHLSSLMPSTHFHIWAIPLLVTQLYDPSPEISKLASNILLSACKSSRNLIAFVQTHPDIPHLSQTNPMLLLQLLSHISGHRYLFEHGWIESELDYWQEHGCLQYVSHVELSISEGLVQQSSPAASGTPTFEPLDRHLSIGLYGVPPLHLYGQLAHTHDGIRLLESTGIIGSLVQTLNNHQDLITTSSGIVQLKSTIWALASIASSDTGIIAITNTGFLDTIMSLLKESPVWSVRGTCFYAVTLLSQSSVGMDMMDQHGWSPVTHTSSASSDTITATTSCMPRDPTTILSVSAWDYTGSFPLHNPVPIARLFKQPSHTPDPIETEVLLHLSNLTNHILATQSSKRLAHLRSQHPNYFSRVDLYVRAMRFVTVYPVRLMTRRFIQELFERVNIDKQGMDTIDAMGGLDIVDIVSADDSMSFVGRSKSSTSLETGEPTMMKHATGGGGGKGAHGSNASNGTTGNRIHLTSSRVIRGF